MPSFRRLRETALPLCHQVRSGARELRGRQLRDSRPGDPIGAIGIGNVGIVGGAPVAQARQNQHLGRHGPGLHRRTDTCKTYLVLVRGLLF